MITGRTLHKYAILASMLLLLFTQISASALADSEQKSTAGYQVAPVPKWVKPALPFDPDVPPVAEANYGFRDRLSDYQFNGLVAGDSSFYYAIEYELTNQHGVENYSSIEISFDPAYEQLKLHELTIKRGDGLINKIRTARFDLLRTERDRSALIYHGTQTLAVVLDDVRVGDTIRYSYTIEGENPIFKGNREIVVRTQPWNATDRKYTRILTSSDRPLNHRIRGDAIPLLVNESTSVTEIIIDQRDLPEYEVEDDVPSWHYDRGTIVFSDMDDWHSVVEWALPMYALPEKSLAEVITIANDIKASHTENDARIGAALRWVQEEIRYFGVELGKNSHWPSRPAETLERRFGDCKDKALLLVALLKELGIESSPALVNTKRGLESTNYPYRMHAFDHVIVHLQMQGESHFIDPTLRHQKGALGDMYEPMFGRALVLSAESEGLTTMNDSRAEYRLEVTKALTIPPFRHNGTDDSSATLDVYTTRTGRLAESMRRSRETTNNTQLTENYTDYYRDYFDEIAVRDKVSFSDNANNTMEIHEQYSIEEFWMADDNVPHYRWLHADEIISYLDMPASTHDRKQAYQTRHPVVIEETWVVSMSDKLRMDDLHAQFKNQWLSFSKESSFNEDRARLRVTFRYATLSNEVAAEDLKEYAKSVEKIEDLASLYLEYQPKNQTVFKLINKFLQAGAINHWFWLLVLVIAAGRCFVHQSQHAQGCKRVR